MGNRSTGQPSGLGAGEVVFSNAAMETDFMRTAFPTWSRDRESNHESRYRPKRCRGMRILTLPEKRAGRVFPTRRIAIATG